MNNKLLTVLFIIILMFPTNIILAQHNHHSENQKDFVEVGNTICPVSGQKIGSMGKVIKQVYNDIIHLLYYGIQIFLYLNYYK